MAETIRERIEAVWDTYLLKWQLLREWQAGHLIPADEVDARIEAAVAEAVRAERERVENLCQALRYRMNVADFNDLIAAIRKEPERDRRNERLHP